MLRSTLVSSLLILSASWMQAQDTFWVETLGPTLGTVALATNSKSYVYAGTDNSSIFRSYDWGQLWQKISNGLPANEENRTIRDISIAANDEIYMVLLGMGVFRSSDDGNSWTSVNVGLPNPAGILTVHAKALTNGTTQVYVASSSKSYLSDNSGSTWTEVKLPPVGYQGIYEVFISPNSEKLIVSIAYNKGIFRSKNRGVTWRRIDADSNGGPIGTGSESDDQYQTIRSNRLGHIYIGRNTLEASTTFKNACVMRSTDDGETYSYLTAGWDTLNTDLRLNNKVSGIAFGKDNDVYASTNRYGMYFSSNAGDNWTPLTDGLPDDGATSALTSTHNNHIFAAPVGFNNVFAHLDPTMSVDNLPAIIKPTVQTAPNPASDVVSISFDLTVGGPVRAEVISLEGSRVVQDYANEFPSGAQTVSFRTSALPVGIYAWRLSMPGASRTGRFVVVH